MFNLRMLLVFLLNEMVWQEENRKKWSGDHLIDPALVPGVIFSNQKLNSASPSITDIYPTILSLFNIRDYQNTERKTLIENEQK